MMGGISLGKKQNDCVKIFKYYKMSGRKKIIYGYRYNPDSYQTELVVRTQDSNHQVGCNHL